MLCGLLPSWLRGDRRPSSSSGRTRAAIVAVLRDRRPLVCAVPLSRSALPLTMSVGEPPKPRKKPVVGFFERRFLGCREL